MIDWKNTNVIFLGVSIVLILLGVRLNDPFGWFAYSYKNAPALLEGFDGDSVDKITVSEDGQLSRTFTKTTSGWTFSAEKGTTYKANRTKISEGLDKLKDMKRYRVVTSNADKYEEYEVEEKGFTVEMLAQDSSVAKIHLGKSGENFNSTLVRLSGADKVYSVSGSLRNDWNQDTDFFRDKKLFNFVKENVSSYKLQGPQKYEIKRNDLGKWVMNLKKRKDVPALKTKIDNVLTTLASLEGTKFYREKKLPKPYARVDILLNSSAKSVLEVRGPTKNNEFVVRGPNLGSDYMTIPKYRIDTIMANPGEVEDKAPPKVPGGAPPNLPGTKPK